MKVFCKNTLTFLQNSVVGTDQLELLDLVFNQPEQSECYERLTCDMMAAGQTGFGSKTSRLFRLIEVANEAPLSTGAELGLWKIKNAAAIGQQMKEAGSCRQVYSRCPYTSEQMDLIISAGQ